MKTLPAFKNYNVCSFMLNLTNDCVESFKIDVGYDIRDLYSNTIRGVEKILWGVRKHGTGMGFETSEFLNFFKKKNMILLFEFSNLKIINGNIFGDISMISYNEKYENKWYNKDETNKEEEFESFYYETRKITRDFLKIVYY